MANPAPTLVSTFEILFTPQLPTFLGPPAVQQVDEFVVKGFFLTLTNPSSTAYSFNLGFHCNVNPAPVPVQRTLKSAVGFLDDGSTGTALTLTAASNGLDFSAFVPVSARGTVLVGILPLFFNSGGLVAPAIECRGWVDITLPALLKRSGGKFGLLEFVAQSTDPVTMLLTPEQRLTFLPAPGDAATAVEAQSAFALPPASGLGAVSIPPQPSHPLLLQPEALSEETGVADMEMATTLLAAPPAQLAGMLSALVAGAPAVQSGRRTTRQALQELGFDA